MSANKDYSKLKRAVIKEELVAITDGYIPAIILNQFLYWTDRVKDFDDFIQEENKRKEMEGKERGYSNESIKHGWVYKSAKELNEETMLGLSHTSINRYVKNLVSKGFLEQRHNPNYKWDRTWQYRVNIKKIATEMEKKGYNIQGYRFSPYFKNFQCKVEKCAINETKMEIKGKKVCSQKSKRLQAIPETTTETTKTKTTSLKEKEKSLKEKEKHLRKEEDKILNRFSPEKYIQIYNSVSKKYNGVILPLDDLTVKNNVSKINRYLLASNISFESFIEDLFNNFESKYKKLFFYRDNSTPTIQTIVKCIEETIDTYLSKEDFGVRKNTILWQNE